METGQNKMKKEMIEKGIKANVKIDCFGLLCPMPIRQTAQKLKEMNIGEILEVTSTDAGIREDMPAWCRQTGQEYLGLEEEGDTIKVYVRKIKE
jgi:tRNA 2-thiouridine synthesizing protein A